jgi:dihydroorotase
MGVSAQALYDAIATHNNAGIMFIAIDPAPHWSGRKREHCSRMFASITHIPSLHKIPSNMH